MSFQNCITFFVEHKHLRKWTVIVWTIWYCMVIKKRDNFQIIFFYVSQKTFVEICGWVEIFFWWTIPLRLSTLKYWKRFKFERQIRYANILFQSCRKTNWGGKKQINGTYSVFIRFFSFPCLPFIHTIIWMNFPAVQFVYIFSEQ